MVNLHSLSITVSHLSSEGEIWADPERPGIFETTEGSETPPEG